MRFIYTNTEQKNGTRNKTNKLKVKHISTPAKARQNMGQNILIWWLPW